jgi:putative transposase
MREVSGASHLKFIKAYSSEWLGEGFAWQKGYRSFRVSASNVPAVTSGTIEKTTLEDKFIALLKKHGVEFDPKYVFG